MPLMSKKRPSYASSAAVRRAKAAIESTGSIVTSVRFLPDGEMEFAVRSDNDNGSQSDFDRLEAAGLL
jgi:uncharacterized protein YkuJ